MIQPLMAAVPNADLLFKAQLLPLLMVCSAVGELMDTVQRAGFYL